MWWWDDAFEFVQHFGTGRPIGVDKRMPVKGWNRSRSCYGPVKKYLQLPAGRLEAGGAEPECVAQAAVRRDDPQRDRPGPPGLRRGPRPVGDTAGRSGRDVRYR